MMLFDDEPQFLEEQARKSNGPIIEIGSFQGESTICLARGAKAAGQEVWAIDPHYLLNCPSMITYLTLKNNLKEFDNVHILVNESARIRYMFPDCQWSGMLFIDGAHDYENVARDLDLYLPVLKPGGLIAVHDCNPVYPGIMKAVRERIFDLPECFDDVHLRETGTHIAVARKRA